MFAASKACELALELLVFRSMLGQYGWSLQQQYAMGPASQLDLLPAPCRSLKSCLRVRCPGSRSLALTHPPLLRKAYLCWQVPVQAYATVHWSGPKCSGHSFLRELAAEAAAGYTAISQHRQGCTATKEILVSGRESAKSSPRLIECCTCTCGLKEGTPTAAPRQCCSSLVAVQLRCFIHAQQCCASQ